MAIAPNPSEIFKRAVEEGERRLDQSLLELTSNSFLAGLTIVFGIVALGIVEAVFKPHYGELARIAGPLAFGIGLVFLIVGRTELFSENFFDPVATAFQRPSFGAVLRLLRLWAITLVLNVIGGVVIALIFSVKGVLPTEAADSLSTIAESMAHDSAWTAFVKAIVGGALVAMLSFLMEAVNSIGSRIVLAYLVGVLLALGPFHHVVVTTLHTFFGWLFGANVDIAAIAAMLGIATAGNLVGGLGLVTFTHIAQSKGAEHSGE